MQRGAEVIINDGNCEIHEHSTCGKRSEFPTQTMPGLHQGLELGPTQVGGRNPYANHIINETTIEELSR